MKQFAQSSPCRSQRQTEAQGFVPWSKLSELPSTGSRPTGPAWPACTQLCPEAPPGTCPKPPKFSPGTRGQSGPGEGSSQGTVGTQRPPVAACCNEGHWSQGEPQFPKGGNPKERGTNQMRIPAPTLQSTKSQGHWLLYTPNSASVQGSQNHTILIWKETATPLKQTLSLCKDYGTQGGDSMSKVT